MKRKSPHILNASSSLLGFSLLIITSLKVSNASQHTSLDEFSAISGVLFACSCLFSFMAIRSKTKIIEKKFENVADYLFLAALCCIVLAVIIITTNVID
ncbi:hypothetical protein ASG01_14560 [Chryseobacterium sp. Leaf180]|uniref:hypothetical protein n=1 Tax=Chryseobacterium sp. Leaf180 TaxID=1736289 RepID=UPI0006FC15A4|nr:hypothetical protein [Chryseobacterium sp. Leaf180]KQR91102.1 hypothetical protein ASG01_14560 [Chryseobacterium sp. Leaf180]